MTDAFDIRLELRDRDPPWEFDPDDYVDIEPLGLALERFTALHDGDVNVVVGDHVIPLTLREDVGMVFDELPDVLERVAHQDGEVELYFAEQGTDLILRVQPVGDAVVLTLQPGLQAAASYDGLPEALGTVDRATFVRAWRRLADFLLDRLEPDVPGDEGLRAYRAALARAGDDDAPSSP